MSAIPSRVILNVGFLFRFVKWQFVKRRSFFAYGPETNTAIEAGSKLERRNEVLFASKRI
jgi:hypothetical protein